VNKKILIVASEFPPGPGGIGHHAFCMSKELSNHHNISVICNGDYAEKKEILRFDKKQKFKIDRYKRIGLLTPIYRILKLVKVVWKEKPDMIVYSGLFSIWMINIGKFLSNRKTKHISIIHGHEPIFGSIWQRRLTAFSLQKFNIYVPVSSFSRENLLRVLAVSNKKINIVPNGIDLTELSGWSNKTDPEPDRLIPMTKGYPKLLTVGHTSPRKGQQNVIRALPEILKIYPDTFYYIVGRDVNNSNLQILALELGVLDSVVFIPPVRNHHDLAYYYKNADIFMLLSENQENGDIEGFGIVALEANYFGCPVIGAKGCGVEDAVSNAQSGYIVSVSDPGEITGAVRKVLAGGVDLKKSSKNHAESFDWQLIGEKIVSLICAE
jgi:phosphatidylinositol alpha-1,6-mannosyltransferase